MFQHTLRRPATCVGIGVHTGAEARVTVAPASAGAGVVFVRTDIEGRDNQIPARHDFVRSTSYAVVLENKDGVSIGTAEHLLAALSGMGVDNARIELDGPEVPILDGSSKDFCSLLQSAGRVAQSAPQRRLRILDRVEVADGDRRASIEPVASDHLTVAATIEFQEASIGRQFAELELSPGVFENDIAFARTFALKRELAQLAAAGLARGGSLENAVLVDGGDIVNPEGLRSRDEFVRHKILDIVGDLSLAGAPIAGRYEAEKPGHSLNAALLRELMASPSAWAWEIDGRGADEAAAIAV